MRLDPARRKKAEAYALQLLNLVDPTGINAEAAKRAFSRMSDEEFNRLREGLPVYNPTGGKVKIDHMRNIKICDGTELVSAPVAHGTENRYPAAYPLPPFSLPPACTSPDADAREENGGGEER